MFGVTAFANGPDEWQLFGISKEGRKVVLTYGGYELEQKNKGISTYLDQDRPAYGFCEAGASATEGEYFLYCSRSLGGKPDLIYKKLKFRGSFPHPSHAQALDLRGLQA